MCGPVSCFTWMVAWSSSPLAAVYSCIVRRRIRPALSLSEGTVASAMSASASAAPGRPVVPGRSCDACGIRCSGWPVVLQVVLRSLQMLWRYPCYSSLGWPVVVTKRCLGPAENAGMIDYRSASSSVPSMAWAVSCLTRMSPSQSIPTACLYSLHSLWQN